MNNSYLINHEGLLIDGHLIMPWPEGQTRRDFLLTILEQYYSGSYRFQIADDIGLTSLALTAVAVNFSLTWEASIPESRGMVFASHDGCRITDEAFIESLDLHPSPRLFVQTLPNIAAGQVANCFEVKGEHLCLLQVAPNWNELRASADLITVFGQLSHCLIGWINITSSTTNARIEVMTNQPQANIQPAVVSSLTSARS